MRSSAFEVKGREIAGKNDFEYHCSDFGYQYHIATNRAGSTRVKIFARILDC